MEPVCFELDALKEQKSSRVAQTGTHWYTHTVHTLHALNIHGTSRERFQWPAFMP